MVIYPDVVCEVIKIFVAAVTPALITTAPADVKLTFPDDDITPLTVNVDELAKLARAMLPLPVVVMPLLVKAPVAAVKLKFTAPNAAFTSVDVVLLVIVYVVNPIPAAKLIACVVLTAAVTVKLVIVPAALPCNRST